MARTKLTTRKSTRGPPHPIKHSQKTSEQEESEHVPEFVTADDNDANVNFYDHHGGGWVDTDTEEKPMELPKDHPAAIEDSGEEDTVEGSSAVPDTPEGEDAPENGSEDPDDDPEPAATADTPPPEPHYKKEVHRLDFAEGPFPVLL